MLVFLIVLALVVLLGIALGFVIKWQLDLPRAPASGWGSFCWELQSQPRRCPESLIPLIR
jgi:hypothetical protein